MRFIHLIIIVFCSLFHNAQVIQGIVLYSNNPIKGAIVSIQNQRTNTDSNGYFQLKQQCKKCSLIVNYTGFLRYSKNISSIKDTFLIIELIPDTSALIEISVEAEKPILTKKPETFNTEVYDVCIMHSSSSTSLFEGIQNINGLRPQLNCNICNTGDIHINGLEGPYTNVLIDGMPVIGGISTVYGLMGISADIIEKLEVNRYPGSVLYGSENIGGTINVITKRPTSNKLMSSVQYYSSSYFDSNIDLTAMKKFKKYGFINSANILWFDKVFDTNNDNFTDVTLQKRISLFHKSIYNKTDSNTIEWMIRGLWEDRWGGQINWNKNFRGSDSIYGESIITHRLESILKFPTFIRDKKLETNISYNYHYQNSYYGTLFFEAKQHNIYYQSFISFKHRQFSSIHGMAFKFLNYIDNTTIFNNTTPFSTWYVPAIYTENTFQLHSNLKLTASLRYDYHNIHKHIITPRMAFQFNRPKLSIRSGITTGFRPVQLFTEDHAALTGARKILISEKLNPEKSYVVYTNLFSTWINTSEFQVSTDFNAWYIYFSNRIIPDYSLPDKIVYSNLKDREYSINRGLSTNLQSSYKTFLQAILGFSLLDNFSYENQSKKRFMLSEPWSGVWIIRINVSKLKIEYTGNIYGKMHLPKAGPLDPRPSTSPVFSIQNIQINFPIKSIDFTVGIKNLLNFTPDKNIPFLIARSQDPFDKKVVYDSEGNPISTPENPYALTFDPTYTYASMQKRRLFINLLFRF